MIKNVEVVLFSNSLIVRSAGAYRIATELRKNNISCQVIDYFSEFTPEEIIKLITEIVGDKTKVIAISTTFTVVNKIVRNRASELNLSVLDYVRFLFSLAVKVAKDINKDIKVVAGGAFSYAYSNKDLNVDVLFKGFSDIAFLNYVKDPNFFPKGILKPLVIDGDAYNNVFDFSNSQIIYNESDCIRKGETLSIEIARGCIFKCKFCAYPLNGKKKNDYIKNKETLREEFLRNYYEYGTTRYIYSDDTHNDNIIKLEMLSDIVQSLPFKLEYSSYIRLDLLHAHPRQYQLLKDAGISGAFFGIESLNTPSVKSIGKGISSEKIIEELYTFKERLPEVYTTGGFIIGLPHETKDTLESWITKLEDPNFPLGLYVFSPLSMDQDKTFKFYKSEFEKNSEKYYTWDDPTTWNNGSFNLTWASEYVSTRCKLLSDNRQKMGSFHSSMAYNMGYKREDLNKNFLQLPNIEIQYISMIKEYKTNLFKQ
jgi:radical SAM superfamily enzyme YgiQ (UPF0313 family)